MRRPWAMSTMSSALRIFRASRATARDTPNSMQICTSDGASPFGSSPPAIRRTSTLATCWGRGRSLTCIIDLCNLILSDKLISI